jgi:hypothetical protein
MSIINLKNIDLNTIIKQDFKLLTIKELLNKINYNLNNIYIDRFWYSIKDDKWIYLDNELILWLEYKDVKIGKEKIIKFLKLHFQDNEDYKILNNTQFDINNFCFTGAEEQNINEEKRGAHNKQYITVSPDCFKELCMHVGTGKSKEIKKYYIELEKVFKFYLEYQNKYRQLELENKNQELEEKENIINKINIENYLKSNFYFQNIKLNREEYIYIASTNKYLHSNIYKVGKTTNFHSRIHTYQTGRFGDDKYYYLYIFKCHNASILEQYILNKLKIFRYVDKNSKTYKELFQLDYSILLNLIKNIEQFENNNISYLNNAFEVYINNSNKENLNKPEIIENITEYLNKKELEYCNKNKNKNEIPDLIDNDDIKNKYNIYANEDNKSNLTKEIIENKLNNTVKLISEYTGNCDDELEFECNSIFKHRFKITYSHLLRKKDRGCYYCTKHGILDKIQIYEYDNKYNYIKSYNGFDELKNLNSNFQLLKNIIREKRWLTPNDNRIYSILEPDNNLLNIKKELNKYEKLILNTLNIKIEDIINKYKKLDSVIKYIYAIDNSNNIIYKSKNYTSFSKKINYINSNKKINRKTIPNYINTNKEYGGYIWLDNINNIEIKNYNTIKI